MEKNIKTFYLEKLRPAEDFPLRIRDTYQDESAEPHTHDYIEIALVHNGRGTHLNHFADGRVVSNTIIKGDVFVILPGEIHSYANCRGYRVYNLCVGTEFFGSLDQEIKNLKHFGKFFSADRPAEMHQLHLLPEAFQAAEEKLRRLSQSLHSPLSSRLLNIKLALTDFLCTIFDTELPGWDLQKAEINTRLFRSIMALEAHPEKNFNLQRVAREAGMSSSSYAHKFKQITGVSPGNYCLFLKLDKVRKLLENKEISLTEAALSCGFSDSNYMIRSFKKRFGITPGAYRTSYHKITR